MAGPTGDRFTGNLRAFEADRLGFMLRARAEYGGLVRFDALTTIVNDAEVAQAVLLDRANVFAISANFCGESLGDSEVAETRRLRPSLNPGMRRSQAASIAPRVVALLQAELTRASACYFDPLLALERVSSRAIADYYFAEDGVVVVDAVRNLLDALDSHFGNAFAMPAWWPDRRRRHISRCNLALEEVVVPLIRRRQLGSRTDDFATALVRTLSHRGESPSAERTAQMIVGSLLAAQRVPAAAAAWMLWEVSKDRELQRCLRAEAERYAAQTDTRQGPSVREFTLAMAVVMETLRLHPPTWLLHRSLTREHNLAGYVLPRGHNLMISPYVLHRDESAFPDPERFDVERWMGQRPAPSSMFPFGRGPRGCPGNEVAISMLVAILLTTISSHEVRVGQGPVVPNPRSTLVPDGLRLRFDRR